MATPARHPSEVPEYTQLRAEGKPQLCLEACEAAAAAGAADAEVLACKAWALACLNRYGDALAALDAATQLKPTKHQRRSIRALCAQLERCTAFADELAQRREYAAAELKLGEERYGEEVEARMTPCTAKFGFDNRHLPVVVDEGLADTIEYGSRAVYTDGIAFGGMCNQSTDGNVYRKHRTMRLYDSELDEYLNDHMERSNVDSPEAAFEELMDYVPKPVGIFPTMGSFVQKPNVFQPNPRCDVWVAHNAVSPECHNTLKALLDVRAEATSDYPMPMYQNIIDPNLLVQGDGLESTWSASLFDVHEATSLDVAVSLQLVAKELCNAKLPGPALRSVLGFAPAKRPVAKLMNRVHDLDPADNALLHVAIEEVFNAAVPLLAELRRPALLLPGPLQAVVKAQRIYLEPGQEYEGVWHYDGKQEEIVAVAIYYYRYSPELVGGDLEFLAKEPYERVLWDDPFDADTVRGYYDTNPRCRVALGEGTLVVFSNYQFIHRVLRMVHDGSSSAIASRDFLLFFVVDQRCPLPSTEEVAAADNRFELRDQLLRDQLKPVGSFGVTSRYICSTGNGSMAHLGWLNNLKEGEEWMDEYIGAMYDAGIAAYRLVAFDKCPPTGRGLSWVFEAAEEELCNPQSQFVELRRHQGPDASSEFEVSYMNVETNEERDKFPVEGVRGIIREFGVPKRSRRRNRR